MIEDRVTMSKKFMNDINSGYGTKQSQSDNSDGNESCIFGQDQNGDMLIPKISVCVTER